MFIQYFDYLRKKKQFTSSTLWSEYSMLNYILQNIYGKKLQTLPRLTILFSLSDINKFLKTAPNENSFLHTKAVAVISFCGGLRFVDLVSILCNDPECDGTTGY